MSAVNPASELPPESWLLRAFDAIYRFLASLKLAVLGLGTLAAVLAFATFFEKSHGTAAVQQVIYRSPWFALLLAFIGVNVLCAALIRFPWARHQTGFVVTHSGLLVVLVGSWLGIRYCDEGHLGLLEGQQTNQLVRIDNTAIRVQKQDPETGAPTSEWQLPFFPGAFAWHPGPEAERPAASSASLRNGMLIVGLLFTAGLVAFAIPWFVGKVPSLRPWAGWSVLLILAVGSIVALVAASSMHVARVDKLTEPGEPFQIVVKNYFPASSPVKIVGASGPDGVPMLRAKLLLKPPNANQEMDVFDRADDGSGRVRWFKASDPLFRRDVRDLGPLLVTFQYTESPDLVEDFLTLPDDPLKQALIRIHYSDANGRPRTFVWPNDTPAGQAVPLPESDLSLTRVDIAEGRLLELLKAEATDASRRALLNAMQLTEVEPADFRVFAVAKPGAPTRHVLLLSSLPAVANLLDPEKPPPVRISYYEPPKIGEAALQGRSGQVDFLATKDGKVYYRAFGREGLRGTPGLLPPHKRIQLVGGPNQPVTFKLELEEYFPSGVEREIVDSLAKPAAQMGEGIPACQVVMTANGVTNEFWLRQTQQPDDPMAPVFRTVQFGKDHYRVALDYVRTEVPFSLKLEDFDVGFDPGTQQASSFTSQVLVNDPEKGVVNEPRTVTMNEPLTWRGFTFYQANYRPMLDPRTDRPSGRFASIFQVRYDPVWGVTYIGCLLVVIGIFLQFTMRAGVFAHRGKARPENDGF